MDYYNIKDTDWEKWEFTEDAVLTFIRNGNELLLIHKKIFLYTFKNERRNI